MNIFDELTFLLVSQHSKISFTSQYFMSNIEGLKNDEASIRKETFSSQIE